MCACMRNDYVCMYECCNMRVPRSSCGHYYRRGSAPICTCLEYCGCPCSHSLPTCIPCARSQVMVSQHAWANATISIFKRPKHTAVGNAFLRSFVQEIISPRGCRALFGCKDTKFAKIPSKNSNVPFPTMLKLQLNLSKGTHICV